MQKSITRVGVLAIAPLLLFLISGCGWEPLRPAPDPQPKPGPGSPQQQPVKTGVLQAEIVYECAGCVISQSQSRTGEAPLAATFIAKVSVPDPTSEQVIHYGWDFGDGTLAEGDNIAHTYQNPGTYRINLRVITSRGNEAADKGLVIVYPKSEPVENLKHQIEEGELCTFERTMPATIYKGVPFKVQVVITTHQLVQVVQWEDNIWFNGFRLKQEPSGVWLMVGAGQRISLEYEAELWQAPVTDEVWMSGEAKCNAGGLGDSEVLKIKTVFDDLVLE